MPAIDHFWAVVPAGGSGTRLWPLSRSSSPKFLHDLTGAGRSLLQETVARTSVAAGTYRWNAGMFVVRPRVLLDLLAARHPGFAASLRDLAASPDRLDEVWPTLPKIAIDHAVAEPAAAEGRVATVPGEFGWDDIGDFRSLSDVLGGEGGEVRVLGDADLVRADAASGLVIPGSGRLVALVGIDDVVVVDTPDALLVTTRAHAQEVKAIVDRLRETGRADLT